LYTKFSRVCIFCENDEKKEILDFFEKNKNFFETSEEINPNESQDFIVLTEKFVQQKNDENLYNCLTFEKELSSKCFLFDNFKELKKKLKNFKF
jgi:hypothetical protein